MNYIELQDDAGWNVKDDMRHGCLTFYFLSSFFRIKDHIANAGRMIV